MIDTSLIFSQIEDLAADYLDEARELSAKCEAATQDNGGDLDLDTLTGFEAWTLGNREGLHSGLLLAVQLLEGAMRSARARGAV